MHWNNYNNAVGQRCPRASKCIAVRSPCSKFGFCSSSWATEPWNSLLLRVPFVGDAEPRIAQVAALYNPSVPPAAESPRSAEQLWLATPGSLPPDTSPQTQAGSMFPAFELVHPQLQKSSADALDLSVYPLVYAHRTLGYIVFDAPGDGQRSWLLEGLAGSLSSAVYAIERGAELQGPGCRCARECCKNRIRRDDLA